MHRTIRLLTSSDSEHNHDPHADPLCAFKSCREGYEDQFLESNCFLLVRRTDFMFFSSTKHLSMLLNVIHTTILESKTLKRYNTFKRLLTHSAHVTVNKWACL